MKKELLLRLIILFLINLSCYSQHSERFNKLIENVNPSDSIIEIKKYKNGKTKSVNRFYEYEYGDYIYTFSYGTNQIFNKKGILVYEIKYVNFGNFILEKQFSDDGEIVLVSESEFIDTSAESLEKFFKSHKHLTYTISQKSYGTIFETNETYIAQEGRRKNGKKIGIWKTYNCEGLVKEKEYSERK